tara:strand:+ start:367 stop:750 length:384 start_codon:yes stop_codon:yes gene_type:complete
MANKSIMQTVKDTTPQDVLLTGVFAGVLAGISGVGNYIDKNITSYTMGFKSTLKPKELFLRGALVGGIIALPFAYLSATSVLDSKSLGTTFVNPVLKGELPPAPKDYVYASADGEQPYLILDPKYGL